MVLFVVLLACAVLASGVWCAAGALRATAPTGRGARLQLIAAALALGIVVGAGALLRCTLIPAHHAMYVDEPWYAEAACNLVRLGRPVLCEATWSGIDCRPYGKGLGWPVLLAASARTFGCHTSNGIVINRVLGSMTVFLVALAVRCAGGRWPQALLAAALLAIHPGHVAWSSTGETNVPAAALFLAGLCGALLYLRAGRASGATLAVSGLGLATAIRPELGLPGIVAGAVVARAASAASRSRALAGGAMVAVCGVALASGFGLWRMNESISGGAFLSLGNLVRNAASLLQPSALLVHAVVPVSAACGALAILRSESRVVWLLACAGIVAALAVLSYERFDERMLLSATVALLPLSGFSLNRATARGERRAGGTIRRIVAAGAIAAAATWAAALRSEGAPPETQLLETRIAARAAAAPLDPNALLIAAQPTVLAAAGTTPAMSIETALRDRSGLEHAIESGRPVYFLCDMYCEADFHGSTGVTPCSPFLDGFELAPVVEEALHVRTYGLYRVTGVAKPGGAPPRCARVSRPDGAGS
jgi:hypothetical protein